MQVKLSNKGPMTMTISEKQENILKHDNLTDLRGMALSQHSNRFSSLKRSDSVSHSNAAPPYRHWDQRVPSPSEWRLLHILALHKLKVIGQTDCNNVRFSSLVAMLFVSFPVG